MEPATRIIPLSGVKNFRDMGGYQSDDGRRIRWRQIYRSGHLSEMNGADARDVKTRNIETVIDFRSDPEKIRHPVHWQEGWRPGYHSLPIGGNAAAWVKELYETLAITDFPAHALKEQFILAFETIPIANQDGLKRFFDALIDSQKGKAVLFHCTAGKDRTGIAGALLMRALDISEDQTMEDFLLTNRAVELEASSAKIAEWLSNKATQTIAPSDVFPLVGVEEDFLTASYRAIDDKFGSLKHYLEAAMGLDPQRKLKLKEIFLE